MLGISISIKSVLSIEGLTFSRFCLVSLKPVTPFSDSMTDMVCCKDSSRPLNIRKSSVSMQEIEKGFKEKINAIRTL